MGWFNDLFSQGATRSVTLHNPLKIDDPKIGFLDLLAGRANGVVVEDRAAFDGMFGLVEGRDTEPPVCDVLLLYCDLNAEGPVDRHSCG